MSVAAPPAPKPLTAEALMAMPNDGIERDLIRGELREKPMTRRNPRHSTVEANVVHLLKLWLDKQPRPRGKIASGEAGFRLLSDPITFVGIDVAYASADQVAATPRSQAFFDGPPVLAVEILSPSVTYGEIAEKVNLYLEVGTVVWVVDPDFRTIIVHRPRQSAETLSIHDELAGDPELPGFRVSVAEVFSD